jgi:hypothetical protein
MSLLRGTINPLNVLGLRKLSHIPPHFAKMTSRNVDKIDVIDIWIYTRLDSRYCVKKSYILDQDKKMVEVVEIGIEEPRELSMFSLGCSHLQ